MDITQKGGNYLVKWAVYFCCIISNAAFSEVPKPITSCARHSKLGHHMEIPDLFVLDPIQELSLKLQMGQLNSGSFAILVNSF